MALIKCPECSKEISEFVKVCPNCGYKQKKLDIVKHKKISTNILITGIILFAIAMIWMIRTSDKDLATYAGYYYGHGTSNSEWSTYQIRSTIQNFMCNAGVIAFAIAVIYKIVLKVKSSYSKE